MPLLTTTIGAYPKPDFVPIPDWFRAEAGPDTRHPTRGYLEAIAAMGAEAEERFARGVKQVVEDQAGAGIDIAPATPWSTDSLSAPCRGIWDMFPSRVCYDGSKQ